MSQFREWEPQKQESKFRFEDSLIIQRLLKTKKLTEKQKEALRRLYETYNYMTE